MELGTESIERFCQKLRSKVGYHLGGFCPDVEDVVQETLLRALNALREHKVHKPENLGAFLSGVCNNVILEYQRRVWREGLPEPTAEQGPVVAPEAEALELHEQIATTLAQLSPRDGELLRAFYLQERDKDEICRDTGLSDTQFRVALFRAKERFRKIYLGGLKRSTSGQH
mgnify:CR=1 FL=1